MNLYKRKVRIACKNWSKVTHSQNTNETYINFFIIVDSLHDDYFSVNKIRSKQKELFTPWITWVIKKFFERKQKLCEKFEILKDFERRKIWNLQNLFESTQRKQEKPTITIKYYNTKTIWKEKHGVSWKK